MNIARVNQALDHGTRTDLVVPLILRGQVIETDLVAHKMRSGGGQFLAPDLGKFADRLPCRAEALQDLYTLSIDDIIDFLADVGATLEDHEAPISALALQEVGRTDAADPGPHHDHVDVFHEGNLLSARLRGCSCSTDRPRW